MNEANTAGDTSWLAHITAAQIIGAIVVLAVLIVVVRKVWKLGTKLQDFLDDWTGDPARPGVPGKPGVMVRLATIEQHLADVPTRKEFNEINRHLGVHDALLTQLGASSLVPPTAPGVHHTVTTVTSVEPTTEA